MPTIRAWWKRTVNAVTRVWMRIGYPLCYHTGMTAVRLVRRMGRRAKKILAPWGRLLRWLWTTLVVRHVSRFAQECKRVGSGFPLGKARLKAAYERHPLRVVPAALSLPALAVRRHQKLVKSALNLLAPVAAAVLLVINLNYWSNATFALQLEYMGEELGYVSDESVFDNAASMAEERIVSADSTFTVERTPKMTIALVNENQLLDESAVCDKILRSYGSDVIEVSGLYVNGKFEGAVGSRHEMEQALNAVLESHKTGEGIETASFVDTVEIVDGLYPATAVVDRQEFEDRLTQRVSEQQTYTVQEGDTLQSIARANDITVADLYDFNPVLLEDASLAGGQTLVVQQARTYLRVQVARQVVYEEPIAFETEVVKDENRYLGDDYVREEGEEGIEQITASVVTVDGVEVSREILNSEVVKEPVTRVEVEGAAQIGSGSGVAGDGIATGKFIYPVPSCHNIYDPYGYTGGRFHSGIDFSGGGIKNAPIVAADGGRVVEVNRTNFWGSGWGYYVLIDHGNGYMTRYAHCSSILVEEGDLVSQGQIIARVGNTGYSTGYHLHFEVYRGGVRINPTPLLSAS